jgi:amidophosphoribosyltransferase
VCGIFGAISAGPVFPHLKDGIELLQHRGQEGSGVLVVDEPGGRHVLVKSAGGLETLALENLAGNAGNMGVAHLRYKTTGSADIADAQPFWTDECNAGLVHNGQLRNMSQLASTLESQGRVLATGSDGELLLRAFARHYCCVSGSPDVRVFDAARHTQRACTGGYAVIMPVQGAGLLAFRDPWGIRPLVMGERRGPNGAVCAFASESVALQLNGYDSIRDLDHGEAVLVTPSLERVSRILEQRERRNCGFEFLYFADANSIMEGHDVNDVRYRMGKVLAAKTKHLEADMVVPVPETSRAAASGYSDRSGVPYKDIIYKYRYLKRIFITPGQALRERSAHRAFRYVAKAFAGKNVILVDDSVVRGTNMNVIVESIRSFGAKQIHLVVTWPPITVPCPYGIDMPEHLLLAQSKSTDEIRRALGLDSLTFATPEDVRNVLGRGTLCMGCVTGELPAPATSDCGE